MTVASPSSILIQYPGRNVNGEFVIKMVVGRREEGKEKKGRVIMEKRNGKRRVE